jgi:hypothetical protein
MEELLLEQRSSSKCPRHYEAANVVVFNSNSKNRKLSVSQLSEHMCKNQVRVDQMLLQAQTISSAHTSVHLMCTISNRPCSRWIRLYLCTIRSFMMPNGSHKPMSRHRFPTRSFSSGECATIVREGLKVEVTPRWVECSRVGIRRRVYGCPSLVGGGTCDDQWAGSLLR